MLSAFHSCHWTAGMAMGSLGLKGKNTCEAIAPSITNKLLKVI